MTAGQIAFAAGVATTVLGTLLGFGLTVLWDRLKVKGEAKRRAEAMVGAMAEETIFNLGILARNATGARQEIAWLDEEKELVPPFVLLRVAALDLAATQLSV